MSILPVCLAPVAVPAQVKVDAVKLRQRLALTAADYNTTQSSMVALCPDLVGSSSQASSKRKREEPRADEGEGQEVGWLSGAQCAKQ